MPILSGSTGRYRGRHGRGRVGCRLRICRGRWIPSGGSAEVARSDFLHRHLEFSEKLDWLRIDRVCGRDGISALRFWVRKSPPTEPARRELP